MVRPVAPLRGFLSGLCVGAADLIPGISGGTVALILGIYEQLIDGLRSFDFVKLLKGEWKQAFAKVPWAFLGSVIGGMGLAIALLVQVIHAILADPIYRPLLYSFFFGLVLSSAVLITGRLKTWKPYYLFLAALGAMAAYYLSGMEKNMADVSLNYWWVFTCGVAGICAMLLPGISGGYLLNVLGMYTAVIGALSQFIRGIVSLQMDWSAFNFLAIFGLGVLFGAVAFSRTISWALRHYHDVTVAVLVGFMLGALRSIWPFWNEVSHQATLPSIHEWILWAAIALFVMGFALVSLANCRSKKMRAG